MDDKQILHRITELVDEEHQLRTRVQRGQLDSAEETTRLRNLEDELDQCWDLLRQRRALREAGRNEDAAEARPPEVVERYEQ
jgi:Protein of unknown function (DUF2630)